MAFRSKLYRPPQWADHFLEWYCKRELLEDLQGDLHELYHSNVERMSRRRADFLFVWWVLRSFRPSVIKKTSTKIHTPMMTRNHIKIAWRVIKREKFHSVLKVSGIAIGIACFLLVGSYAHRELSYDRFHSKRDQIYRVWVKEDYGEGQLFFNSVTPFVFEPVLRNNFSQIENVVQLYNRNYLVGVEPNRFSEPVAVVSPSLFSVFDFNLVKGSVARLSVHPDAVVISQAYEKKYFGNESAVGKMLPMAIDGEMREFTVCAVMQDIPQHSSIQFDLAISSLNNTRYFGEEDLNHWFVVTPETYVLVGEDHDIKEIEAHVQDVVMSYLGDRVKKGEYTVGFQPLVNIHLDTGIPPGIAPVGNRSQVLILSGICILVLVIACVNYVILSVGESLQRGKEVGLRKVMGAFRLLIVRQYLTESILIVAMASVIGILLAHACLPIYNELTGAHVSLSFEPWHVLVYVGLVLLLGVASGFYPGLVLSGWNVISILKGNNRPAQPFLLRNGMVAFEFLVTVLLISSSLIMYRQMNLVRTQNLGYQADQVIVVRLPAASGGNGLASTISGTIEKGKLLQEQLRSYPEIGESGIGNHVFGSEGWGEIGFTDNRGQFRKCKMLVADAGWFETFGIRAEEGRLFQPDNEADKRQAIIINQAAAKYFGLDDPVGGKLPNDRFQDHVIIGITDDFHHSSLHHLVEPLIITQNPAAIYAGISDQMFESSPIPKLVFRYNQSVAQVKDVVEEAWDKVFPDDELVFNFVDEHVQFQYASDIRMQRLVLLATILSIIIASLGLLGLTVLTVNSRIKEIGIRKVVGASNARIFGLLSRQFAFQLVIGLVLSIPLTQILMNGWLGNFAYRITPGPGTYLLSALILTAITFIVISFHTVRASRSNPVNALRNE